MTIAHPHSDWPSTVKIINKFSSQNFISRRIIYIAKKQARTVWLRDHRDSRSNRLSRRRKAETKDAILASLVSFSIRPVWKRSQHRSLEGCVLRAALSSFSEVKTRRTCLLRLWTLRTYLHEKLWYQSASVFSHTLTSSILIRTNYTFYNFT